MSTVYDIPRTPSRRLRHIEATVRDFMFGDVDYGPDYGYQSTFVVDDDYIEAHVAELIGDELATTYQDDFRQVEVVGPGPDPRSWIVKVHIAWGDGHYTPVT